MKILVLVAALLLIVARAAAQCGTPTLWELGGLPTAVCAGGGGTQVIARARWLNIVNTLGPQPVVMSYLRLDHAVVHMHTEAIGRIWAIDGSVLYGIDVVNSANPSLLSRFTLPVLQQENATRVRVHGNFVYVTTNGWRMFIIDVSNAAAPIIRATFVPVNAAIHDVEVVGSYAYLAISGFGASPASLMVVDIASPTQPVEVRRVGNGSCHRITFVPGQTIYTLNDAGVGATHIQRWNLAAPSNPTVLNDIATGTTIPDDDEIAGSGSAVCLMERFSPTGDTLRLYNPTTLAAVGPVTSFTSPAMALCVDGVYAYVAHYHGPLDRFQIGNPASPVASLNYFDVPPGVCEGLVNVNNGWSVAIGSDTLWFFKTNPNGAPTFIRQFSASAGRIFLPRAVIYNDLLYIVERSAGGSAIRTYRVTISPAAAAVAVGSFGQAGNILSMDLGTDSNSGTLRAYYAVSGAPCTLHVLNVANPAAMVHDASFSLTSDVGESIKHLPGSPLFGTVSRVCVGGHLEKTQIVSVANTFSMFSMGVIPAGSSTAILQAAGGTAVWLLNSNMLRAYDISTPASPVLLSSRNLHEFCTDLKYIDPFGNTAGAVTGFGRFIRLYLGSMTNPYVMQAAQVGTQSGPFGFDGTVFHMADGPGGYKIVPPDFDAAPAKDPMFEGEVVYICPNASTVLNSHMVAMPAIAGSRWYKDNVLLVDGPTGTGSTITGSLTGTLTITNPGPADAALYRCDASNFCDTGTGYVVLKYCYANCDCSTAAPILNVNDFQCFLNKFAVADAYTNCDHSTASPVLNVNDFQCFLNAYAVGCN